MTDKAEPMAPETLGILRNAGTAAISDAFDNHGRGTARARQCIEARLAIRILRGTGIHPLVECRKHMPAAIMASSPPSTRSIKGSSRYGQVRMPLESAALGICWPPPCGHVGCIAAVVDGGVRDVAFLEGCGMPVIARYRTPAQGVGRWRVTASQTTIKVRGALADWVTVNPGDIVAGDADGIIVVPLALVSEVTSRVASIPGTETAARAEIAKGLPLLDALKKYGHL